MHIEWLPILLSAIISGLLSLVISHLYYRWTSRMFEAHHDAQLRLVSERHEVQMKQMQEHHAEQVLVLRTTLLAVEEDSDVEAARDAQGNLTGGVHHHGEFIGVPGVSPSAVTETPAATDKNR